MKEYYINKSVFGIDYLFSSNKLVDMLNINGYPILAVLWNIFLLIIPFFICLLLVKYYLKTGFNKIFQKVIAFISALVWLLFIPNSVYIITEIRHLNQYCQNGYLNVCPERVWLIMFFFIYSIIGWIAFVYLLNQMKLFIKSLFSDKVSNLFIVSVIPVITFGVLFGLINRFNSWDFFVQPVIVIQNMLLNFSSLSFLINWIIFTLGLYILYFIGNIIFQKTN